MFKFETNETVVIEQKKAIEAALSTKKDAQKTLRKIINEALKEARDHVASKVHGRLDSDPRGAAWSIRRTVYKKILGANMNILNMRRKAGKRTSYEPPRTLREGQRGGNRVPRGKRTDQIMHYGPHDRAWILRLVNSGTAGRTAGNRGGRLGGNRGSIAAKHFFEGIATTEMERAAQKISDMIESELEKMLNESK